jgi:cytochrome c oxidase cbb3-type subunit 3
MRRGHGVTAEIARGCVVLVFSLVFSLAFALGCDSLPGKPREAERYRRPAEVLDFETLYATNCSGCHGADGTLGPARPLADPLYLRLVGRERAAELTAHGIAGSLMPAFLDSEGGTLTREQIDALTDGIFARWAAPAPAGEELPAWAQAPGSTGDRGGAVFATYCADCHGADGLGGRKGGAVLDPSFLRLVSDQMLRTAVIAGRPDLGMPDWREASPERAMSAREIADVVAWMSERRP